MRYRDVNRRTLPADPVYENDFDLDWASHREAVSTLHVALENGSDLHVNERQKIRHYRGMSTG